MTLLEKLLSYLPATFDKSPDSFLAFKISHTSSNFRWVVFDHVFYGFDFSDQLFAISLTELTIRSLIEQLLTFDGTGISNVSEDIDNSALTLLPTASDVDPSQTQILAQLSRDLREIIDDLLDLNSPSPITSGDLPLFAQETDSVYAYTSLLCVLIDSVSSELSSAKYEMVAALDQMSTVTADGEWLDEWGGYFGILRTADEPDRNYGVRIIAEVIRPRENNVAITSAIRLAFGQDAEVVDAAVLADATYFYDGTITYSGSHTYDAYATEVYGLFDVACAYNLESSLDQSQYAASIRVFIEKFRAAGTHMRSLSLGGTVFSDAVSAPSDTASMTVHRATHYDGSFKYNNSIRHSGDFSVGEVLS